MIFTKHLATLFLLSIFFINEAISQEKKIRIACMGESITYGDKMQSRGQNAYPAQLQAMLGNGYQVANFGVSEAQALPGEQLFSAELSMVQKYRTDIIFILPSAVVDSNELNKTLLTALVKNLQSNSAKTRIVLILPPPYWVKDSNLTKNPFTKDVLIPFMQEVAFETGSELINVFSLFDERTDLFPDTIHMSSLGATLIAKRLYETVIL